MSLFRRFTNHKNVSTKIFIENMEKILNINHKEDKYAYFLGDYITIISFLGY